MDNVDRTLVRLLQEDADRTYADLGRRVNLSAAAVHERVRKLGRQGVIRRRTIEVDPVAMGALLAAFVYVDTLGWITEPVAAAVRDDARVEELHSIAGNTDFLLKVRVGSASELEDLLQDLYRIPGVQRIRTSVVLRTHLERPPQVPRSATAPRTDSQAPGSRVGRQGRRRSASPAS